MSGNDCPNCPTLQAQVNVLASELNTARQVNAWLRDRLSLLVTAVLTVLTLISDEAEKQTMPRGRLLGHVQQRLTDAIDELNRR